MRRFMFRVMERLTPSIQGAAVLWVVVEWVIERWVK